MVRRYLLLITLLLSSSGWAQPLDDRLATPAPAADWRTLSTPHFNVHFRAPWRRFAVDTAIAAETAHERLVRDFDQNLDDRTEIVIHDPEDSANGAASPFPFRRILVNMSPPRTGELLSNQPWLDQLMTHEYTHILHQERHAGLGRVLRRLFGTTGALPSAFATHPQLWAPAWLAEGLAIRAESATGQGRDQSAIFTAKMRSETRDGLHSLSRESYEGYRPIRWPFGHVYLYGAFFFQFLDETYGPDKTLAYLKEYDDNIVPWRMNHRAEAVFGLSEKALWAAFEHYLQQRFDGTEENAPAPIGAVLAEEPWLNRHPVISDTGEIYYYHDSLIAMPEIRRIDPDGTETTVLRMTGVRYMTRAEPLGLLIGRSTVCDNRFLYTDLYLWRPGEGRPRRLTRCARILDAVMDSRHHRIIAVQGDAGQTRLITVDLDDGKIETLHQPSNDARLGRIDLSPDGKRVALQYYRPETGWNIDTLSLTTGHIEAATRNGDIDSHPRFTTDGKALLFLSDHGGRVELRRLEIGGKEVETLSSSTGYIADFAAGPKHRIVLTEYTANGFRLRLLGGDEKPDGRAYPAIEPIDEHSPVSANTDWRTILATLPDRPYDPLQSLYPRGWQPIIALGTREDSRIGFSLRGEDALGLHRWELLPLWFAHENVRRGGGFFSYRYDNRLILSASRNIVSEEQGDTTVWSEENRAQLLLQWFGNRLDRGWRLFAGAAAERIDTHAKTTKTSDDRLFGAGLAWNTLHHYGRSISVTDGIAVSLMAERYAGNRSHEGNALLLSLSAIRHLGRNHHLAGLLTTGQGDPGIAPFSLGGSEDLPADIGGMTPFGQRRFAVRGYEAGKAGKGNHFVRASIEWRFPIADLYDGLLSPPVGLGRLHGALFADGTTVDTQAGAEPWSTGVGFELGGELLIGFDSFTIPLTLGVAKGLDDNGTNSIYLRTGLDF